MVPEFVVVGGGIVGCAVAWGLARRGASVVLVERDRIASGASGGPGWRGVRASGRDLRELPLAVRAYEIWPLLSELLGSATGYRRIGSLHLVEEASGGVAGGQVSLEARQSVQVSAGVPTTVLGREDLAGHQQGLGPSIRWALYCPLDGVAAHESATKAFATAAAREGADVREGEGARLLRAEGQGMIVVDTGVDRISAGRAVFVLNNWRARSLLQDSFGIPLPIWHIFPQMNFVRAPEGVSVPHLIGHDSRPLAIKSVTELGVMLSGGRTGSWDEEKDTAVARADTFEANFADAVAVLPELEHSTFLFSDVTRSESCSVDGIPIIDRLPTEVPVFFGTGWSGHGFATGPAVAECLVEWALSGVRPAVLAPFGLDRFPARVGARG